MADVTLSGDALIQQVDTTPNSPGEIAFWWLGQNGFIFKGEDVVVYVDPYLAANERRQTPPALRGDQVTHADVVLCSHDHTDHIDREAIPAIAAASPDAVFVVPNPAVAALAELGVRADRIIGVRHLETVNVCGLRVTGIKTRHERFDEDPELGFPYLGYVIECNGLTLYHAGDANLYEGLVSTLQPFKPVAAFLPINGRDAERLGRGCLGNMTFQEAVDLAGDIGVDMAVPMHWDMFAGNSEDPHKFVDYMAVKHPHVKTWVGAAGERVVIR